MAALALIRERVKQCEADDVAILCCPEGILGGLADYSADQMLIAIATRRIASVLAPLASDAVTTIVGFTELGDDGALYNSAAVLHRGTIAGVYRKQHPAIRRSVYAAGTETPVFHLNGVTFGIVICYDSNFSEPARQVAEQGALVLFVPSNNGLPRLRACEEIAAQARQCDVARAIENRMWVVRADVAGESGDLVSAGASAIVRPGGSVMLAAQPFSEDFLVVNLDHADSRT